MAALAVQRVRHAPEFSGPGQPEEPRDVGGKLIHPVAPQAADGLDRRPSNERVERGPVEVASHERERAFGARAGDRLLVFDVREQAEHPDVAEHQCARGFSGKALHEPRDVIRLGQVVVRDDAHEFRAGVFEQPVAVLHPADARRADRQPESRIRREAPADRGRFIRRGVV